MLVLFFRFSKWPGNQLLLTDLSATIRSCYCRCPGKNNEVSHPRPFPLNAYIPLLGRFKIRHQSHRPAKSKATVREFPDLSSITEGPSIQAIIWAVFGHVGIHAVLVMRLSDTKTIM